MNLTDKDSSPRQIYLYIPLRLCEHFYILYFIRRAAGLKPTSFGFLKKGNEKTEYFKFTSKRKKKCKSLNYALSLVTPPIKG